ncbi:hypothetical protein ACVB8X_34540 [Streptomyces sp. NRAIS4]
MSAELFEIVGRFAPRLRAAGTPVRIPEGATTEPATLLDRPTATALEPWTVSRRRWHA